MIFRLMKCFLSVGIVLSVLVCSMVYSAKVTAACSLADGSPYANDLTSLTCGYQNFGVYYKIEGSLTIHSVGEFGGYGVCTSTFYNCMDQEKSVQQAYFTVDTDGEQSSPTQALIYVYRYTPYEDWGAACTCSSPYPYGEAASEETNFDETDYYYYVNDCLT